MPVNIEQEKEDKNTKVFAKNTEKENEYVENIKKYVIENNTEKNISEMEEELKCGFGLLRKILHA